MKLFGGGNPVKRESNNGNVANNLVSTSGAVARNININQAKLTSKEVSDEWRKLVGNKVNTNLEPLLSPELEEMPNWNILPSYQLYQSTFSKSIDPLLEDLISDPPTYEIAMSPLSTPEESSIGEEEDYFSRDLQNQSFLNEPTVWENSILGNTHRLKLVADYNKEISEKVEIKIFLTSKPSKVGVPPTIINPQEFEFSQGDVIHGFFYVTNKSEKRIPFDMISVVFEGRISVIGDPNDTKKPIVFSKFLNMFDYLASWSPTNLNESETIVDPVDNSVVLFPEERYFEPGVKYKKVFNFKIPYGLLDCACTSDVLSHIKLIPSFGLEKEQFINNLRRQREMSTRKFLDSKDNQLNSNQKQKLGESKVFRVKELAFPDTSVSYSVIIRIIGKSSNYSVNSRSMPSQKDEYVILNYSSCYLRVIPRDLQLEEEERSMQKEADTYSKYFVKKIKEIVGMGGDLIKSSERDNLKTIENHLKSKQLYSQSNNINLKQKNSINGDSSFQVYYSFKKKILGSSKVLGSINLSTPKLEIRMSYNHPPNFKSFGSLSYESAFPSSITIPVKMILYFGGMKTPIQKSSTLPSIKAVSARLVVVTFRSKKYAIPIDISNEFLFKNISGDDNIERHLVQPFKNYLQEISKIIEVVDPSLLNVDRQLIMDIKSLATLSTKYNYLKFDKVSILQSQMNADWTESTSQGTSDDIYEKEINIKIDLDSLLTKESFSPNEAPKDPITLVPDFQSCYIGRKYYVEVSVKMNNNEQYSIKLPLRIMAK